MGGFSRLRQNGGTPRGATPLIVAPEQTDQRVINLFKPDASTHCSRNRTGSISPQAKWPYILYTAGARLAARQNRHHRRPRPRWSRR